MEKTEGKKKEYTVNFGMTEEVRNYLKDAMDRIDKQIEEKPEKIGNEARRIIVDIVKREISKIDEELAENDKMPNDKWFKLMEKLDKLSDIVRFY